MQMVTAYLIILTCSNLALDYIILNRLFYEMLKLR